MTEYPAYWAEQPSRFVAPAHEPDPAKRALLVMTWFLTTLKQQYDHRADRRKGKPLNPVLGELFLGRFENTTHGTTQIISEQVCHHPPVTAYKLWNDDNGISLSGYHATKTHIAVMRSIHLMKVGHVVLHIDKFNEDHLITFPQVHLEGFLTPPPFPEFDDHKPAYIQSSSGYTTKISFSGKGWLRGKRHSFFASLYPEGKESEPLYTANGQWTGTFTVEDVRSNKVVETYNAARSMDNLTPVSVAPLEEQDPMEGRRLWSKFATAMYKRDINEASAEKSRIEVRQREMRKEEEEQGKTWEARYFSMAPVDSETEALCTKVGLRIEPEPFGGSWKFDKEKYKHAGRRKDDPFSDEKAILG